MARSRKRRTGWIENAIAGNTYTFTTSLVDNLTHTFIQQPGLTEWLYVDDLAFGSMITDSSGNTTFSWTPLGGQHRLEVRFPGQSYYTNTSIGITVAVERRTLVLAASGSPPDSDIGQNVKWNVIAYDMMNNETVASLMVHLYVDGSPVATNQTNSMGYTVFTHAFSSLGLHNVTFLAPETPIYSSAIAYQPLMVFARTALTLQGGTVYLGRENNFNLTLKDANGAALSNRNVRIEINGVPYLNVTTDNNGRALLSWRPDSTGNHSIMARFGATGSADLSYRPSAESVVVSVISQTITNTNNDANGSQSVSFTTAQGSVQSTAIGIIVAFPSAGSVQVLVNGFVEATAGIANEFGWRCTWVGCLPFWNVHIVGSALGVLSFNLIGSMFGVGLNVQVTVSNPEPVEVIAGNAGALAAAALLAAATAVLTIPSGPLWIIPTFIASTTAAVIIGIAAFGLGTLGLRSYLRAFMASLFAGIPALIAAVVFGVALAIPPVGIAAAAAASFVFWSALYILWLSPQRFLVPIALLGLISAAFLAGAFLRAQ